MALVTPVDTAGAAKPDTDEPGELAPQEGKERSAPVRKTVADHNYRPGDLICGECGTGNSPLRKFCSRCGNSLASAVVARASWWQRLFHRKPKVLKAGTRPKKPGATKSRSLFRQIERKARAVIGIAILLAGILYAAYPPFRNNINSYVTEAKQKVFGIASGTLSPIRPATTAANMELPGHPAKLATDEFNNTYWLATWGGVGATPPTLTLTFNKTVILRQMIIYIGASDKYTAHDRPSVVELQYSNEKTDFVRPKDTSDKQQFSLPNGVGVTSVQIKILDVFPAQGSSDVGVTEVELFGL
jgi:hypothetical protein